jgi:peptidoglycan lytic transglycosylase
MPQPSPPLWRTNRLKASIHGIVVLAFLSLLTLLGSGCASTRNPTHLQSGSVTRSEVGLASYYAEQYHGKRTASGEIYNMYAMTAAHPRLPFGSKVTVVNLENRRSALVRINDRGPNVRGRIIDVSLAAARQLGLIHSGIAKVQVELYGAAASGGSLAASSE